ncbi:bifunctional 2',3'-cyclic-nucleotide 2'-phosphodiesterase/3'-nucleotidase [Undibacterium sp. RuTC16W]|uniref:bifunctional 2',3'-cyclic-nucleotide 2'-phosphodiesterase/3'-nucleotidase n=1 Tax=Undibacterium sp. RuTC16W TaxID=3413048 RepID=UPI003BEFB832
MKSVYSIALLSVLSLVSACSSFAGSAGKGSAAELVLLETTDLHANVLSYDYYKLAANPGIGLERTANLIRQARAEFANTMLFDNGDAIQGTALADFQLSAQPLTCRETLAIYKVMNALGYDAAGLGNHEFNFGLPVLAQVTGQQFNLPALPDKQQERCAGPQFPLVLANILSVKDHMPIFPPYVILEKEIQATSADGVTFKSHLKVGVIGFTPPSVLQWDKRWLDGQVVGLGIREQAEKYIPEMRARGADLVIVISHGSFDGAAYSADMENANYHLAKVPGIDALLLGHAHQLFPDAKSQAVQFNLPGVDKVSGWVHGVPAVMASFWGQNLGLIKLGLRFDGQHWQVDPQQTTVQTRGIKKPDGSYVTAEPDIALMVRSEHEATIAYVKTPIGQTDFRMSTYFADLGDVSALQIVNQAQTEYVRSFIKTNLPQYRDLPVLSMSAPFKSGVAGATDYTDITAGELALNHAADLYLYPNTVSALKVNGEELKNWLEHAARRFNQIDPEQTATQNLIAPWPGYHFDMLSSPDIRYEIDVTQALGQRIRHLEYLGKPVSPAQEFIVATNSYRASGGGGFPGIDSTKVIYASPDASRDVLIHYIKTHPLLSLKANGMERSWHFSKVRTAGPLTYISAKNKLDLARQLGLINLSIFSEDDGSGKNLSVYRIDLSK